MAAGIKLIAECRWSWRNPATKAWEIDADPPYIWPACIGPTLKKISVWLPSGKRIVCRTNKFKPVIFPMNTLNYYRGAGILNKIEIVLRELLPGEQRPAKPHADTFKL